MKCTSQRQAEIIAQYGFQKMFGNYTFRPFPMSKYAGKIIKHEDGTAYTVNAYTSTCNCGFYNENREYKICNHILFVRDEMAFEEAMQYEYDAWICKQNSLGELESMRY